MKLRTVWTACGSETAMLHGSNCFRYDQISSMSRGKHHNEKLYGSKEMRMVNSDTIMSLLLFYMGPRFINVSSPTLLPLP